MENLWCDEEAAKFADNALQTRVYTSRLLGKNPDLVLHGGGNTSVKTQILSIFDELQDIIYIKGSGWDLASIEAAGFAPVRMDILQRLAKLNTLTDTQMVKEQRAAMIDPGAPTPSVEAILHAIIPFKYVDHTHADAIVTITNTKHGEQIIRELYGERVLIIPYVMPGFILAKKIDQICRDRDWNNIEAMILLNHGVFTFADDAKTAYERMINIVTKAENYLQSRCTPLKTNANDIELAPSCYLELANLRKMASKITGQPILAKLDNSPACRAFTCLTNVANLVSRGPLTPDHVIRTKRTAMVIENNMELALQKFCNDYTNYFREHSQKHHICLDPAPRWAVWLEKGIIGFGTSVTNINIVLDIVKHTIKCIEQAEQLDGWQALPPKDIFEIEYWELEQAKLAATKNNKIFQGKIALVTGAASGIGKASAIKLQQLGAAVVAIDKVDNIATTFDQADILGLHCDVTNEQEISAVILRTIKEFGGLDILISNAGTFPSSLTIANMSNELWQQSIEINLTSHQKVLRAAIPYLELGIDPAVVIVGSKNVPAPGPGASAYSVAKAGLTQLARVAALELAASQIRVNSIHPDAVFDTGIWTDEILENRAKHYGLSTDEYKTKNLLKVAIHASDVADLICTMVGPSFAKTTGAQVPIDGGNERVI